MRDQHEDELLKAVALRNASSILQARQRAENDLLQTRDALERKTEELARSLSMMKATLDSATDGFLVTDECNRVTGYNEKFVQMWQLPRSALEAHDPRRLWDTVAAWFDRPDEFVARVQRIYSAAPPTTFDVLVLTDGRVIERQSRPQVVEGRAVGRVWSYRDITEQRGAEEALRDETRVLELLNRTGRSLASKLDLRDVVQAVTDAGTQISGARFGAFFYNVTNEDGDSLLLYTLSGVPREAFEKFGQPRATAVFGPTLRGGSAIRSDDITQDPRYGQLGPHHGMPPGHLPVRSYLAVSVVSRSGEVLGGLFFGHPQPGVFTERSERIIVGIAAQAAVAIDNARLYEAAQQAAEERKRLLESERSARNLAERMSAMKDDFLATLSHELRTPLSAILGWVHIMRRDAGVSPDMRQGLDTIERNSRLQVSLIDDLLDMNRIASGKVRLDLQPVEPLMVVMAALETVEPAAQAKGVQIEHWLDPSVGGLPGDPARLQQVLVNLLSNAVKFTPGGGHVNVVLERKDAHVQITVTDSGIGIAPEFVDHVFERFRQADSSTTRRYGGLGLGLSIVKSLVELHGGTVSASSPGQGQGASFCVRLPAEQVLTGATSQDATPGDDRGAAVQPPDLSGLVILVVDDDADCRELARRVLAECGANVLAASSADEALRLVASRRPDVLVSDIGMPDVDGFTLLRRLRSLGADHGGQMPAIALTAFARPEDRAQALDAGFAAHLSKPAEPPLLQATVARLAGRAPLVAHN